MLIHSLFTYSTYYRERVKAEFSTGTGHSLNLKEVATALSKRIVSVFTPNSEGQRLLHGTQQLYQNDPYFKDLILFYEYFHGDNVRGVGTTHQTGWTGLVADLIDKVNTL